MPVDPVCGKEITDLRDAPKTEYHGKLYYFESADCKRAFEDDPRRYTSGKQQ
jgi:YHS domain-containing protein